VKRVSTRPPPHVPDMRLISSPGPISAPFAAPASCRIYRRQSCSSSGGRC
jgi:hypothetical protein